MLCKPSLTNSPTPTQTACKPFCKTQKNKNKTQKNTSTTPIFYYLFLYIPFWNLPFSKM